MGPESFVLDLVSPRVWAEEEQGPGKLQQRPGHGRCRALRRFPSQACSVAPLCWSFVPWAPGATGLCAAASGCHQSVGARGGGAGVAVQKDSALELWRGAV